MATKPRLFRHPMSRIAVEVFFDPQDDMTHQAHAESCDVNTIIRQFDRTGVLPPVKKQPRYGDVSNLNRDLTELLEEAESTVEALQNNGKLKEQADAKQKLKQEEEAKIKLEEPTKQPPSPPPTPESK